MKKHVLGWGLALAIGSGGMAAAASPAQEDPVLAKLQQMVGNLGYNTTTASDKLDHSAATWDSSLWK